MFIHNFNLEQQIQNTDLNYKTVRKNRQVINNNPLPNFPKFANFKISSIKRIKKEIDNYEISLREERLKDNEITLESLNPWY